MSGPASLRPYVPDLAVEWLRECPEAVHRTVEGSLAFADISGFTRLTERLTRLGVVGSEELSDILDSTFSTLLAEAHREGADLVKWGGDAVLLLFRGEDHAARAVRATLQMRQVLHTVGRTRSSAGLVTLRMSVGVHSGLFDFFLVGDPAEHRELVVSGPAASRAAELEAVARAGQVVVSGETAALLPAGVASPDADGHHRVHRAPPGAGACPAETDGSPVVDVAGLLPSPVRRHLLAEAGESEHRPIAVAFLQFSGTDALLREQGAGAVAAGLDQLVRRVQAACAGHEVTFLESDINRDGGKIMLVCGAPTRGEDVDDRLVRAVHEVVGAAGTLPVRAGINRGRVFASDFGPTFRRTYSVKGDAINAAARVMGHAWPGQVLATRAVLERVRGGITSTPVPPFRVKGKARPIEAALVTSTRPVAPEATLSEVFLGRTAEVATLRAALDDARSGHGGFVEVLGPAGLGKSALVQAALSDRADGVSVLHGPSRRFGATPHQSVRRLLREVIGAHPADPVADQVAALRTAVDAAAPDLLPWFPLLATLLGAEVPDTPQLRDLDDRFRAERAATSLLAFLAAVLTGPTVFLLEGADDMDDSSADLVRRIIAGRSERPWLVLTTRRTPGTGLVPDPDDPPTTIELEPLSGAESLDLLRLWTTDDPLGDQQLQVVAAKAAGNPLHLRALLELTVARGSSEELPDSVEEVIGAEIDGLPPRARTILRFASVLGEQFDVRDLTALVADEGWRVGSDDLQDLGGQLYRERADTGWYRFRSQLVHDVAYAGLPYRLRRRLHLRAGESLEASHGDPVPVEALSTHFFEAGRHDRALRYSRLAAERAGQAYSHLEAMDFYARALVSAARSDDVPADLVGHLHESIGDVAELAGLSAEAIGEYRDARPWFRSDPVARATVMAKEVGLHQRVGAFGRSVRIAGYARRVLADADGPRVDALRSRLALQIAFVHHLHARHPRAIQWSQTAVQEALRSGDRDALARAYNGRALFLAVAGVAPDQPYGELALAIAEQSGDLQLEGKCLTNLAIASIIDGHWSAAEEQLARAAVLMERVGDSANVANVSYNRCDILVRQGRWEEVTPLLVAVGRAAHAQGDPELTALVALELGRVYVGQGRLSEALAQLTAAEGRLAGLGLGREAAEAGLALLGCRVAAARTARERERVAADLADFLDGEWGRDEDFLPRLHFLRGAVEMSAGRPAAALTAFEAGLAAPAGEGGFERALNELGVAEASGGRADHRDRAGEALAGLGVRALPFPLPWTGWS